MEEVSVIPYDTDRSSASPMTGVEQRKDETHDGGTTGASGSLSLVKIAASARGLDALGSGGDKRARRAEALEVCLRA